MLLLISFTVLILLAAGNGIDEDGIPISDASATSARGDIDSSIFPVCANVSWTAGNADVRRTLYDCVDNIADAYSPPRFVLSTLYDILPIHIIVGELFSGMFVRIAI
jgi:hypothetical protein